jgi:hypothetical protein
MTAIALEARMPVERLVERSQIDLLELRRKLGRLARARDAWDVEKERHNEGAGQAARERHGRYLHRQFLT